MIDDYLIDEHTKKISGECRAFAQMLKGLMGKISPTVIDKRINSIAKKKELSPKQRTLITSIAAILKKV